MSQHGSGVSEDDVSDFLERKKNEEGADRA